VWSIANTNTSTIVPRTRTNPHDCERRTCGNANRQDKHGAFFSLLSTPFPLLNPSIFFFSTNKLAIPSERLLNLAGIERSLLPELVEAQLGFTPHIPDGSPDECANLDRLERLYEQLLKHLESKETEPVVGDAPPNLKLIIQEYTNILQEIRKRLDKLANRAEPGESLFIQTAPVYYAKTVGERIVVGNQYGEEQDAALKANSLYTLASENACWLMQLADVERFAVDDCILLTNSDRFQGWEPHEIKTTILSTPLPIPDDLATVRAEKLPAIEKRYFNGNTALTYSSTDRGTSLIPAPISFQSILVSGDQQIVLMQRSPSVAFYPNHWSVSFEGTMNTPITNHDGTITQSGDESFFATAMRELDEEFAIPQSAIQHIRVLSLNVEYLTLSVDVITLIRVDLGNQGEEKGS
jgi:hypothetical protein